MESLLFKAAAHAVKYAKQITDVVDFKIIRTFFFWGLENRRSCWNPCWLQVFVSHSTDSVIRSAVWGKYPNIKLIQTQSEQKCSADTQTCVRLISRSADLFRCLWILACENHLHVCIYPSSVIPAFYSRLMTARLSIYCSRRRRRRSCSSKLS